jgi:peptidoglycan/LPS O-acetylase OafA/YrhL
MSSIEAGRGVAALCVVLMHAANLMAPSQFSGHVGMWGVFDFGYVGVDFFFVLSGFIITYVHYKEIGNIKSIPKYLWRRFSRIYPIYWTMLLIAIIEVTLGRFISGKAIGFDLNIYDIPGTILLLHSEGEPKYIGVAWTLQYEVMFYLVFCVLLVNARLGGVIFIAWGLYLVSHVFNMVGDGLPFGLSNAHCLEFLFGVAIGVAARRFSLKMSPIVLIASLTMLIVGIIFEVYGPYGRHAPIGRLVLGVCSAAILVTLVGLERVSPINTPKWLVRMGATSYSIYLGHIIFIELIYVFFSKAGIYHHSPEWIIYISAVTTALCGTMLIGLSIELPIVIKLKNLWSKQPTD